MINKEEISYIFAAILVLALAVSIKSLDTFLIALTSFSVIVVLNIVTKKIFAYYYEIKIEMKIWEVQRYGFKPKRYFKKPIWMGLILPVITAIVSLGNIVWMACLVFDVKPRVARASKRHGLYSFSELTEEHIGYIAAAGIFANLLFAVAGYFFPWMWFQEFAKLSILYVFYNMIPISDLDGNKIFFGNIVLWSFLAALTLVGMGYVIFIV
jgi:hypothetical protein